MARAIICLQALSELLAASAAHAAKLKIVQVSPDTCRAAVQNRAGIFGRFLLTRQRAIPAADLCAFTLLKGAQ